MSVDYVNYLGQGLQPVVLGKVKRAKKEEVAYHKGWRVMGVSQAMVDAAEEKHAKLIAEAVTHNERVAAGESRAGPKEVPGAFDADKWIAGARPKPVRPKPYEILGAAQVCADLARKAGWKNVTAEEKKHEVSA